MSAGSVHGRFQVLHNEHMDYILSAKKKCDYLYIGITNYERNLNSSGHRALPRNNPLTYFERVDMIVGAMEQNGVSCSEYCVVPFPIENPSKLEEFVPIYAVIYTTLKEPWNSEKIRILRNAGYRVEVIIEGEKGIEGVAVRALIADRDDRWRVMVPKSTEFIVDKLGLAERLK